MATTFEELCRVARTADGMSRKPVTLEEQRTLHNLKLWAYASLSDMVERGLELMDHLTGDPDFEDGTGAEDAFEQHSHDWAGPGCSVGDPDCCEDADRGEEDQGI